MQKNFTYVYHASPVQDLKILKPRSSTHKKSWVYGALNIETAAMFLGNNNDFICQTGISFNDKPHIIERFEGALEKAYAGQKGSIYELKGETFKSGQTSFMAEVVSEVPVEVLEEKKIEDVLGYLLKMEKEDKVEIYRYPNKPKGFPDDKSDIVDRAIKWTIDFGEDVLKQVQDYHPDVLKEVVVQLNAKNYQFKDKSWQDLL